MIYVIVGYSGSGKSTVIERVAKERKIAVLSHGEMIRSLAREAGYGGSRELIELVSDKEFRELTDKYTIDKVSLFLDRDRDFIFDGLASIAVLRWLKRVSLRKVIVVSISAPMEERTRRITNRIGYYDEKREHSKIILGLDEVISNAKYTIDGTGTPEELFLQVMRIIDKEEKTKGQKGIR